MMPSEEPYAAFRMMLQCQMKRPWTRRLRPTCFGKLDVPWATLTRTSSTNGFAVAHQLAYHCPLQIPAASFQRILRATVKGKTIDIPDHHGHTNYSSVDDDAAAEPEVNRLIETGFVKEFSSYEDLQLWVEGQPHLSRLGMITKEKDGKTKRRLILDCKESRVNERALGQQMPLTMLCIS